MLWRRRCIRASARARMGLDIGWLLTLAEVEVSYFVAAILVELHTLAGAFTIAFVAPDDLDFVDDVGRLEAEVARLRREAAAIS